MISLANIEITTIIAFALLFLFGILGYTKKMSIGIALASAIGGFVIAYIFAPYNQIIITATGNAIWYGYEWSILAILGLAHMVSMFAMVIVAGMNLFKSGGKIVWA